MPPKTPKQQRTSQWDNNDYDSSAILIAVGIPRRDFYVPKNLLKKTSFFKVEKRSRTSDMDKANTGVDIETAIDLDADEDIEAEQGRANVTDTEQAAPTGMSRAANPKAAKPTPNYHLTSKLHTWQAFLMVLNSLHNGPPSLPESNEDCKFSLQAYLLAEKYNWDPLQNDIVDCFRIYHTKVTVNLDHLMWMIVNTRDNTALPMTAYLVQQTAYEIADEGIEKYVRNNKNFDSFMVEGDSIVRYELVKAIAHRATAAGRRAADPATSDTNSWYSIGLV